MKLAATSAPITPISPAPHSGRLLALDQIRGLCLMVLVSDHANLFPSLLSYISGRGQLWVTAAEGFFFISGLMAGLVRRRQIVRQGFTATRRKLWQRARQLYITSVMLTLAYTAVGYWLAQHNIGGAKHGLMYFDSSWQLVVRALSQFYVYGWSDFLPYYALYLFLAPLALWFLMRGRWAWVLALSVAGWILPWLWTGVPTPMGLRWQLYFFGGLVFGYFFEVIRTWWHGRSPQLRHRFTVDAAVITVAGLVVSSMIMLWPVMWGGTHTDFLDTLRWISSTPLYQNLFQHERAGLLRPVFFGAVFTTLYLLFQRYQAFIHRWIGWLLEPLGANSLYVYILHGPLVFALPLIGLGAPTTYLANTLIPLGIVLCLWILVKRRLLFKLVPH